MFVNILLLGVSGFLLFIYLYFEKSFSYWRDKKVLFHPPSFPFGNLKDVGKTVHFAQRLQEIYTKFQKKDKFAGFFLTTSPRILAIDLDFIKNILIKDFDYFHNRGIYFNEKTDPLSANLFFMEGTQWKSMRALLTPTFTSGKIKMMFHLIHETGNDLIKTLQVFAETKQPVDAKNISLRFNGDAIASCAFGIKLDGLENENSELIEAGKLITYPSQSKHIEFFLQNTFKSVARKLGSTVFDAKATNYFKNLITGSIELRGKTNDKRNDFINILIDLKNNKNIIDETTGKNLTINQLAAQAFIFFFAGFETVSTTLMFCLYELALNQEIQQKVREEIKKVSGNYEDRITYEGCNEMVYLLQIINGNFVKFIFSGLIFQILVTETLRKYSPIHILFRSTTKDYKVPDSNHIIEKDTAIFIPVYSIHNDPKIYPEPEIFDPERFTQENINKRHSCSFLPFGDGPRNCIGVRFAYLELKIALALMLLKYKFTLNSRTKSKFSLNKTTMFIDAEGGIWLDVEEI